MKFPVAIVGGGLTGLLLSLKISRDPKLFSPDRGLFLFENLPFLGGRIFSGGFGFEILGREARQSLERHLMSQLTFEEQNRLEESTVAPENQAPGPRNYFVRKSFVTFREVLQTPTDLFTRKEAERLFEMVVQLLAQGEDDTGAFEKSGHWTALSKADKDAFEALFETVVGFDFGASSVSAVRRAWMQLCTQDSDLSVLISQRLSDNEAYSAFLSAPTHPQLPAILASILENRGVKICTGTAVTKLRQASEATLELTLSQRHADWFPEAKIECDSVALAVPLTQTLRTVPREAFRPAQSKIVGKFPPKSLAVLEYRGFAAHQVEEWPTNLGPGSHLIFPVERCKGFFTHQGHLCLSAELDFEQSLQAPNVRDAIARMRRAACRLFKQEAVKRVANSMLPKEHAEFAERVVLLPDAYPARVMGSAKNDLKEVRMAMPGLFLCGDFFRYSFDPWRNIVESAAEVVAQMPRI